MAGDMVDLRSCLFASPRPAGRRPILDITFRERVGQAGIYFVEQEPDEGPLNGFSAIVALRT